ncbi:BtrH N-terminal domain-containing protein [Paenibacillus sp. SC116]|uniref:BtrH N-terminal domain-containing protein n=1 Tax=Paenibacillus sp. SC116 TaxID=2968986 RepID=UPI00215B3167|nr:BtrH N-terminal domain-containing protein [Paenibacillus sp. SC116]MCR8843205.1 BtrH N-terminal domain-containing protein [Paenibacillus sp. SC116]
MSKIMPYGEANPAHLVKLGALECAMSSISTALKMIGRDPGRLLMHYWNLTYYRDVLYAGRNVMRSRIETFGDCSLQFQICRTSMLEMKQQLINGCLFLYQCRASHLPFFPRNMLNFEASGFDHYVLVFGYDENLDSFHVADPICEYIGLVTRKQLEAAAMVEQQYYCYSIQPFGEVTNQTSYPQDADSVLVDKYFTMHYDVQAFDQFIKHLHVGREWNGTQRRLWTERNILSIASLIKMRTIVWEYMTQLRSIAKGSGEALQLQHKQIIKLWNGISFLLLKYKMNDDSAIINRIEELVHAVTREEAAFMQNIISQEVSS